MLLPLPGRVFRWLSADLPADAGLSGVSRENHDPGYLRWPVLRWPPTLPLRLYAAGRLAFRLSASSLTRSDSRIRTKPVAANTTGSLSRIGHDGTIITTPYLRRVQINGRWTLLASMGRSSFISAEGLPTLIASVCLPPECEVQFEVGNVRLGTMYTSR